MGVRSCITAVPHAFPLHDKEKSESVKRQETKHPLCTIPGVIDDHEVIAKRSGLVIGHLDVLCRAADETNYSFGVRPVEPAATGLVEAGYATKDFHVKGKSASWGPQAGFIPVNQQMSKLEGAGADKINDANERILTCVNEGYAEVQDLVLSKSRLDEQLLHLLPDQSMIYGAPNLGSRSIEARAPSGRRYQFTAQPLGDERYKILDESGEAVRVLGKKDCGPLTADYDLLFVAPPLEDFGEADMPCVKVAFRAPKTSAGNLLSTEPGTGSVSSKAHHYANEDPDKGNITPRISDFIRALNEDYLGRGPGHECFHHSDDAHNPYTDPAGNYPATIFLPSSSRSGIENLPSILMVEDHAALREVILELKKKYQVPTNSGWSAEFADSNVRRPCFDEALNYWKERERQASVELQIASGKLSFTALGRNAVSGATQNGVLFSRQEARLGAGMAHGGGERAAAGGENAG